MDKTMDMLLDERREQRRLEHEKARKRDPILARFIDERPQDVAVVSYRLSDTTGMIYVTLETGGDGVMFELVYNIPSEVVHINYHHFKLSSTTPAEFWQNPKVLDAIIESSRQFKR